MWVLFGRGAFDAESVRLSAQSLAAYALGLPAFVLVKVLAPGFFARGDTATPVKIGVAAVVLNLAMNVAFMVPLQHIGPALATSLAAMFNVGWLAWCWRGAATCGWTRSCGGAACGCWPRPRRWALALAVTQHVLFATALHGVARMAALAVLVAFGLVAYAVAAHLFGAGDLRELGRMVRRGGGTRRVRVAAESGER